MPEAAQSEVHRIEGQEVTLRWKSPRFGEWLAWCYVPGPNRLPQEGIGFEARAATPEAAKEEVLRRVRAHLAGRGAPEGAPGPATDAPSGAAAGRA